ncbi:hypothetical protein KUCAC02_024420 [Chaenocephalus aceratus]|uniref:Uncharacterized protein n=1 Tax=Chaenocephalus aceratus TaxID=36190 RepID=A0ACB9WI46_CHAAC|nr:hypothetical protein KUCAC02_024420 [Chaenocephalus aceratus]
MQSNRGEKQSAHVSLHTSTYSKRITKQEVSKQSLLLISGRQFAWNGFIKILFELLEFVDPRFNTDSMSAENVPDLKARVKIKMEQVARKEKRAHTSTTDAVLPSAGELEPSTSKKAKRSLGSFFKSSAAVPPASTAVQLEGTIEAEVFFGSVHLCFACRTRSRLERELHCHNMKRGNPNKKPSGAHWNRRRKREEEKLQENRGALLKYLGNPTPTTAQPESTASLPVAGEFSHVFCDIAC